MIHTDGQPTIAHRTERDAELTPKQLASALARVFHDLRYTSDHPNGRSFGEIGPLWWDVLDAIGDALAGDPAARAEFINRSLTP